MRILANLVGYVQVIISELVAKFYYAEQPSEFCDRLSLYLAETVAKFQPTPAHDLKVFPDYEATYRYDSRDIV